MMIRILKKKMLRNIALISVLSALGFNANAQNPLYLSVSGITSTASGLMMALVPAGSSVTLVSKIDYSAFLDGTNTIGEDDVLSITANVGGVCIAGSDVSVCDPASTTVLQADPNPNFPYSYAQPGSSVDLTSGGAVYLIGGLDLGLVIVPVPITLTFGAPLSDVMVGGVRTITGTLDFLADPGSPTIGIAEGTLTYELAAIPVPASAWLMGSAIAGLVVARRKKAA